MLLFSYHRRIDGDNSAVFVFFVPVGLNKTWCLLSFGTTWGSKRGVVWRRGNARPSAHPNYLTSGVDDMHNIKPTHDTAVKQLQP